MTNDPVAGKAASCPFCDKLANLGRLPSEEIVVELTHSVALLGPWQYYHGYCLVVARRHATELSQLEPAERHGYFEEMCLVAAAIEAAFAPDKLNYELLGNQVRHLHWHLFPRYRNDPDAQRPVWLALERAERDSREQQRLQTGPLDRAATAARLRENVHSLRVRSP